MYSEFSLVIGSFCLLPVLTFDLTNITEAVFGGTKEKRHFIPAAFGDFNSDKLTDLIALRDGQKTVQVLLATQQNVVSSGNDPPVFQAGTEYLECNSPDGKLLSAVPADFDGDGGMDLMMLTKKGDKLTIYVVWGVHHGVHSSLECTKDRVKIDEVVSEPLVFDNNGDFVADLLTVDQTGNRTVYQFSHTRQYQTFYLVSNQTSQLKAEHSNAWLDLSGDGAADLLLTTQEGLEMYEWTDHEKEHYRFHKVVAWPDITACTVDECVGQAVFTDFDLDGRLDMLLPVCFDPLCANSSLYLVPLTDLWTSNGSWTWTPMSLDLGQYRFLPRDPAVSPLRLVGPRVGDVDLDGWPDLIMTLYNVTSSPSAGGETHLLLNTPCGPFSGCRPFWRQFQVQPGYTAGTGLSTSAAFFDLYDDGSLDLLLVQGDSTNGHWMSAYTNTTQDSDAYFMKVMVLSGVCYHNCPNQSEKYVPYGTNSGGQTISYQSQRPGPETFDSYQSVAAQLSQTAYFSLQLPYTIFGLGLSPNFVDYMSVNTSRGSHMWPQIIPNSQLYVIPYGEPEQWDAKLIIFTSKNIFITGLAMVGTCALVSCIIVALHIRERRMDHQAKLQEANRFHFDAM